MNNIQYYKVAKDRHDHMGERYFKVHTPGEYMQHLSSCNLNQNWDEALEAMADTPNEFRDEGFYLAEQELEHKRKQCTCGLEAARNTANNSIEIEKKLIEWYQESPTDDNLICNIYNKSLDIIEGNNDPTSKHPR